MIPVYMSACHMDENWAIFHRIRRKHVKIYPHFVREGAGWGGGGCWAPDLHGIWCVIKGVSRTIGHHTYEG